MPGAGNVDGTDGTPEPKWIKTTVSDVGTRADADVETRRQSQGNASVDPPTHHGWLAQAQGRGGTVGSAAAACGSCWAEEGRPGSRLWLP